MNNRQYLLRLISGDSGKEPSATRDASGRTIYRVEGPESGEAELMSEVYENLEHIKRRINGEV